MSEEREPRRDDRAARRPEKQPSSPSSPSPSHVADHAANDEARTRARSVHGESIIALSNWLQSPPGRYVLAWEQLEYDALVADIFGFNAVQVGLLELPALRGNRMPFIFAAGEWTGSSAADALNAPRAQLLCSLDELPFASQSLDLVVLPHALEFADDPHRVLREVERVLMPEGQVVISGFNPISLWGARQYVGRTVGSSFLPTEGQFLALPRLKDWLKLLGFEVHRGHSGAFYRGGARTGRFVPTVGGWALEIRRVDRLGRASRPWHGGVVHPTARGELGALWGGGLHPSSDLAEFL